MGIYFVDFFIGLPAELVVLIISMIPVVELRGALPLALTFYHLNPVMAYLLSVFGNLIPVMFILLYISDVSDWLIKRSALMRKFFDWLFKRTRHKMGSNYEKYGLLALAVFVAIPLPMTGAWTGALGAWLFGVDKGKAMIAITTGVLIAGVIILIATTGAVKFLNFII
jgi:uncharacterized membrane protein